MEKESRTKEFDPNPLSLRTPESSLPFLLSAFIFFFTLSC